MLSLKRPLRIVNLVMSLLVVGLISPVLAFAQADPTPIVDAAYKDLSAKLGVSIVRQGNTTYTFEQDVFADSSLGCPQPGQAYSQVVTKGYKILITYPRGGGNVYDYRASVDGTTLFQCSVTPGSGAAPTTPPNTPASSGTPVTLSNPFAFVDASGNITMAHIGDSQTVLLTGDSVAPIPRTPFTNNSKTYSHLTWSPDGSKLLYFDFQSTTLYLASSGTSPIVVNTGLKSYYPGAWSADGKQIAFAVPSGQTGAAGQVNQIQSVTVTGSTISALQYAGTFTQGVGCGGGEIDTAEARYYDETGYAGNDLVLAWTPKGFVYSMTCMGSGLALADSTGKVLWHVDDVGRVALSADRTRAIATKIDQTGAPVSLELIDLSSGGVTPLATEAGADQSAWSADGTSILYSTLAPAQSVKGNPSAPAGHSMFGDIWPWEAKSWTATLYRMPVTGGTSTKLFQREGRAIGTISPSPDNAGVLFSFVTASTDLINQINAGAVQAQLQAAIPHAELYYVPLAGNAQAVNLTRGGQPAFGKGTFTVVPAVASTAAAASTGGQGQSVAPPTSNVTPPLLVIGGQAIVTTTRGDTLNLRQSPGRTAPILGILKPGTLVTILAGPQIVDGLRWWQVRGADNRTGWVIDQITDQDGTTNTLAPQ